MLEGSLEGEGAPCSVLGREGEGGSGGGDGEEGDDGAGGVWPAGARSPAAGRRGARTKGEEAVVSVWRR